MPRPSADASGSESNAARPTILVYAPFSFNGQGPAQTCAAIVGAFPVGRATTVLHAGRFRRRPAGSAALRPAVSGARSMVPWRLVGADALSRLDDAFEAALEKADPDSTVAYFWPDPPVRLVERARERGVRSVREMINTALATSGPLLDAAFGRFGLAPTHGISSEGIAAESAALQLYDACFAPNPEVEKSLLRLGLDPSRVLPTTFGWSPERFAETARRSPLRTDAGRTTFLFVGSVDVRKGVPELLEAWAAAGVGAEAELVLVGRVAPALEDRLEAAQRSGGVRALGFRRDVGRVFRAADVFVFPTLEEGGPQVTYEAAGCGLPIITTPMGAARLVETGSSGVVVDPGSVEQLAAAIRQLVERPDLRAAYGTEARRRAEDFSYARVGPRRLDQLLGLLDTARR